MIIKFLLKVSLTCKRETNGVAFFYEQWIVSTEMNVIISWIQCEF